MIRQLILTEDGSHTIFVPEMGEHYHSVHGAMQESLHIFIQHGFNQIQAKELSILEIGFGTGLNALLTLLISNADNKPVIYETWEKFPLSSEEIRKLNYPEILKCERSLYNSLHQAAWEINVPITPIFTLRKIESDILNFHSDRIFDLVYFDAFGPDFQPELWTAEVFSKIAACQRKGSRLVTYSAKGQVRRNLREAGYMVEKAPGPPGKREITIAIKT
ncbi:MAG: tRNA (5-methylaminomethyl-2-thiouridine)(34)-methyltransferase MnmD [Bacteroidales bacterium]|nr:tRNA (5-methylaminomethyl-2-thiouridine)(34)-methyltransferase MnmD [Bacteroidales bacterium]